MKREKLIRVIFLINKLSRKQKAEGYTVWSASRNIPTSSSFVGLFLSSASSRNNKLVKHASQGLRVRGRLALSKSLDVSRHGSIILYKLLLFFFESFPSFYWHLVQFCLKEIYIRFTRGTKGGSNLFRNENKSLGCFVL
jgi:hypothetical protein